MAFTDVTTGARIILEGFNPVKITLAGDCKTGDLLGYSTGWKQADANNTIYPKLVAGETAEDTEIITAYQSARIGGITTGTAGADLYLSDTAGGYHHTASATISQRVGFELGSGEMMACPKDYVEFRAGSTLPACTLSSITLAGAVAGGDQAFTGVGDMTFTAGSILAAGATNTNTLIVKAGGLTGTAFITLTSGATDECEMEAITMKGTWLADGTVTVPALTFSGDLTVSTHDFVSDTTTGTKIGTAVDQKIGFFGITPIIQQAHISDAATTIAGYATINAILAELEEFGFVATS